MGYSVPEHFKALNQLGPCVHHRRRFAPVAALLGLSEPAEIDETAQLSL
jgi:ribonuclease HII